MKFAEKGERQHCSVAPHAECESVCKPGSVLSDHLSVALRCRGAQAASSERPGRPCVFLHGVAPDRVYSADVSPCRGRALISAFPPLPRRRPPRVFAFRAQRKSSLHSAAPPLQNGPAFAGLRFEKEARGGISLLHLSEGHPWRALPVILALWSPDFPHALPFGMCPRSLG